MSPFPTLGTESAFPDPFRPAASSVQGHAPTLQERTAQCRWGKLQGENDLLLLCAPSDYKKTRYSEGFYWMSAFYLFSSLFPLLYFSFFFCSLLGSWQLVRWLRLWEMRVQIPPTMYVNTVYTWHQLDVTIFMPCRSVWDQLSHSCWIRTKCQSFSLRFPPWCHPVLRHHHLDRLLTSINTWVKRFMIWLDVCLWKPNCFTSLCVCP